MLLLVRMSKTFSHSFCHLFFEDCSLQRNPPFTRESRPNNKPEALIFVSLCRLLFCGFQTHCNVGNMLETSGCCFMQIQIQIDLQLAVLVSTDAAAGAQPVFCGRVRGTKVVSHEEYTFVSPTANKYCVCIDMFETSSWFDNTHSGVCSQRCFLWSMLSTHTGYVRHEKRTRCLRFVARQFSRLNNRSLCSMDEPMEGVQEMTAEHFAAEALAADMDEWITFDARRRSEEEFEPWLKSNLPSETFRWANGLPTM